jgi:hypothetical protein
MVNHSQDIPRGGPGVGFLSIRLALLFGVGALSGCAFHGFSLPKGVYLPNCSYGVLAESQPARCMTRAEYKAAKEKTRQSREDAKQSSGKEVDPRYKDWIP